MFRGHVVLPQSHAQPGGYMRTKFGSLGHQIVTPHGNIVVHSVTTLYYLPSNSLVPRPHLS